MVESIIESYNKRSSEQTNKLGRISRAPLILLTLPLFTIHYSETLRSTNTVGLKDFKTPLYKGDSEDFQKSEGLCKNLGLL